MGFELLSRTADSAFFFALFEGLLSGVIVVVLLRSSPGESQSRYFRSFLPAAVLISGSLAYTAAWSGLHYLGGIRTPELAFSLAAHLCRSGAWMIALVAVAAPAGIRLRHCWMVAVGVGLMSTAPIAAMDVVAADPGTFLTIALGLDIVALALLAAAAAVSHREAVLSVHFPVGFTLLGLALLFHIGSGEVAAFPIPDARLLLWNLSELFFSAALLVLALAIGELAANLFDTVFVRVQIVFILLASVIIFVLSGTERSEYLDRLRSNSRAFGSFVTAAVGRSAQQGMSLTATLDGEVIATRIVREFGANPDLAALWIESGGESAAIRIDSSGQIATEIAPSAGPGAGVFEDENVYFLIDSLRLPGAGPGALQLYGLKERLDHTSRRRTAAVFLLFTLGVGCATLLVGFVIRRAEQKLRQQERELQQASKLAMLGELAGSVAHEVNNPATTIMSRASFLLHRWKDRTVPEDEREDLQVVVSQAQRIADITNSLLGYSRKHVVKLAPVDLEAVILKSVELVRDDLERRSIEFRMEPHSGRPVAGDEQSLIQVFVNLLRNSIDALPEGGVITTTVAAHGSQNGQMRVDFRDNGTGIPEADRGQVFQPFFTTKKLGRGTGLGLSVVHGIISEHKGTITVESIEGEGTTFHLTLPCWRSYG